MQTLVDRVRGFVDAYADLGAGRILDGREVIEQDTNCVPSSGVFWLVRLGVLLPAARPQIVDYPHGLGATELTSQVFSGQAIITICRHDDPITTGMLFSAWTFTDAGVYQASEYGFTVMGVSAVRDVTSEVSSYFERGAQLELNFQVRVFPTTQPLDTISEVVFVEDDGLNIGTIDLTSENGE